MRTTPRIADLRDDTLTFTGEVKTTGHPGAEDILIEYQVGSYYRQFKTFKNAGTIGCLYPGIY